MQGLGVPNLFHDDGRRCYGRDGHAMCWQLYQELRTTLPEEA